MAIAISLVAAFPNRLRYLCVSDGGPLLTATIPNDAGVSPDLRTDSGTFAGPIFQIARVRQLGLGIITVGTRLNGGMARAFLCDDGSTNVGNSFVPRTRMWITPRTNASVVWTADAGVNGPGDPVVTVTAESQAVASAYLDIIANPAVQGGLAILSGGGGGTIPG